jgi:hypothetical protein
MEKHRGQIVEYLVRRNGYSITDLASELNVNRRSIYNYFQNNLLKSDVIFKIGYVIRHDFSREFPEFFTAEDFSYKFKSVNAGAMPLNNAVNMRDEHWKDKYLNLLEIYNEALLKKLNLRTQA